jgi:cytochrome c biogenesis protein CcmG, thiol:disulfide interchange protein DsbE
MQMHKVKVLFEKNKAMLMIGAMVLVVLGVSILSFIQWNKPAVPTFKKEYKVVLTDYAGKEVRLSEFKNKVLVAYVWASWCPYCGAEIENLARLKQIYGEDIQVIAINRSEPPAVAKDFTDHLKEVTGVVFLLDSTDSFFKSIEGYAMPETVFIRPNGDILLHQRGPMKFPEVVEQLKSMVTQ